MSFQDKIKELRQKKGISQKKLADAIGVAQSSINYWEKGQRTPSIVAMESLANYFNVPISCLMDRNISSHTQIKSKGISIPVLGRVAAGIPISAVEDIIDTEEITPEMARTGDFFGLQIHGDSMEPRMAEGDVVIVRQQDDAESGDIVIATVNGDEATCKRLMKYQEGIALISTNPAYNPMFFSNTEIEGKPVRILGKVVELRAKF